MAFLTVFITTILVTLLIHLVPGDPVQIMFAQSQGSTPEQIEEVRRNLGLDKPIYVQYFMYVEKLFQGDLGYTIRGGQPVIEVIFQRLPNTAKGLPKGLVLRRHVLRAGLVPLITMMGLQFAFMMRGAIVVENIFSWNGVGRMAVEAIFQRDYPIIQGFILTFAVVVVIVSIFLDTIYAFIDPRIRRG